MGQTSLTIFFFLILQIQFQNYKNKVYSSVIKVANVHLSFFFVQIAVFSLFPFGINGKQWKRNTLSEFKMGFRNVFAIIHTKQ